MDICLSVSLTQFIMNTFFSLYLLLNFYIVSSSSIVSQILPSVSIFEESPISSVVVDLRPILQTFHVHPHQAALLHSQPSQPFEYLNGRIQLKSRLDREDYVRKRLCLGGNILECNFTLTLTVNLNQTPYNYILSQPISCHDINDIIPKFSQIEAKIYMAENVPIGHRIPLETASDVDSPPYGIDHYRLETINGNQPYQFAIVYDNQSRELELIVKEKLDREKIEKYLFKLIAIDRGHPANIGTQMLTIEITDINDSRPRFESSIYNITVAENTIPEYLLKIQAIDLDIGINAELIYTLENDSNNLFRMDPTTGVLTLTQALDYEIQQNYQLKVEVHDKGLNPMSDTCLINIFVLDQNDHPPAIQMKFNPIFEHQGNMAYVKESFDINLPLVFVTVHDQDSGEHGKAQLTVEPHRLFYLETLRTNYYAVKASRHFDRESMSFYQIELRARDFGQPILRRSMTFELNITDVNDQIPQFKSNYTFDLIENNRIPAIIGQINAQDSDQGVNGQISYTIIPPSSYFSIDSHEGIISTNTSFDYERQRQYKFQVRARDHGQATLQSFIWVEINIINLNEYSPQFERDHYEFFINENETREYLGQVKAFDRDSDDTIVYSLSNYEDIFRIDQLGRIFARKIFDREEQDQYRLTVIAKDNSTIGTSVVTIHIRDINDNPPIFIWPDSHEIRHILSEDHSQRIDRENPSAQLITDIIIRDDDLGTNALINLTNSNNQLFYIGLNHTLWLRNSSILPGSYELELEAKNFQYISKKFLRILIYEQTPLAVNIFYKIGKIPLLFIILLLVLTISLILYYLCLRKKVKKSLYGSRLIVNDEEKSKESTSPTKIPAGILPSRDRNDFAVITKQRKNSQPLSATSPSTTDGEFSSSLLSCPMNGQASSSSTSDLDRSHYPPNPSSSSSSALSALTTLTRKSPRHFPMKNVSFQPASINPTNNIFNDLFQNTSSTFSTLPKLTKRDLSIASDQLTQSNGFPTLQTILQSSTKLPQPPPLLNGILLLDQMLTRSSIDEQNTSNSTVSGKMNDQWYNVTCNYQTRASIV